MARRATSWGVARRRKKPKALPAPTPDKQNILDACRDPEIFGPWFKDEASWANWFVFLKALFGIEMTPDEPVVCTKYTGRSVQDLRDYYDATLCIGRRGGKSLILALIAAYLATF